MADAVKFAGDHAIEATTNGLVQNGHHRLLDAILHRKAVDVVIVS